jgi:peptidyl-prolyl cis-trans isomerase SurA
VVITFGDAVSKYSDDENAKFTAGISNAVMEITCNIDELDKDVVVTARKI